MVLNLFGLYGFLLPIWIGWGYLYNENPKDTLDKYLAKLDGMVVMFGTSCILSMCL